MNAPASRLAVITGFRARRRQAYGSLQRSHRECAHQAIYRVLPGRPHTLPGSNCDDGFE